MTATEELASLTLTAAEDASSLVASTMVSMISVVKACETIAPAVDDACDVVVIVTAEEDTSSIINLRQFYSNNNRTNFFNNSRECCHGIYGANMTVVVIASEFNPLVIVVIVGETTLIN